MEELSKSIRKEKDEEKRRSMLQLLSKMVGAVMY